MAKRTPIDADSDATTKPILHGHYDGPRGRADEHRHLGGGHLHGHQRGDKHLPRGAHENEYVHGDLLPKARQDARVAALAEQETVDFKFVPPAAASAELVKTSPDGQATRPNDATVASFVTHLANLAEHERWSEVYATDIKRLIELGQVLEQAERDISNRSHVGADHILEGLRLFRRWSDDHGIGS